MSDTLKPGDSLGVASELNSANGKYRLVMQEDGNLVAYIGQPALSTAYWASHTDRDAVPGLPSRARHANMQADGNFVLYADNPPGFPVWATGTDHHDGAVLVLQDDANIVIYETNGNPIWASHTVIPVDTGGQQTPPRAEVKGYAGTDVGYQKRMDTNATLYRNGGLVIDAASKCDNWFAGMKGEVFVVVVDNAGRAIWVSDRWTCSTKGSIWDPTTPSYGHDNFYQELPEPVGRFAARLDILQADILPGTDLSTIRDNFVQVVKGATEIAAEIIALVGTLA